MPRADGKRMAGAKEEPRVGKSGSVFVILFNFFSMQLRSRVVDRVPALGERLQIGVGLFGQRHQ